tara:strand:- start:20859 stop:21761 length:903 start_codon:yes stop_codon:yes gene_type:complete
MAKDITLPNLLIVGAAKSGTTSLHNYLNQHPDIYMSKHKEPHFLINRDIGVKRVHKAVIDLNKYKEMFMTDISYKYKGESSVMYLAFPEISIKNIKRFLLKDIKIIIMLRHPVERAFAGYLHNLRYNPSENLSFEDAIDKSEERYHLEKNMTPDTRYLHVGMYSSQVKRFMDVFSKNVHVILYDDYVRDINSCIDKVFDFLDVEKIPIDTSRKHMVGGWMFKNRILRNLFVSQNTIKSIIKKLLPKKAIRNAVKNKLINLSISKTPEMSKQIRDRLLQYYKDDIIDLSKLLKRDLGDWLK